MLINVLGVLIYYVNFLGIFDNFNKKKYLLMFLLVVIVFFV